MRVSDRVTVICIAYNHAAWIEETLESVRLQDHYSKELIIVDNGSKDETQERIQSWVSKQSGSLIVKLIHHQEELPYCQAFNQVLADVESPYLVDLSGDDVMYPEHLSQSIKKLKRINYAAFVFSDAYILSEEGEVSTYYRRDSRGELVENMDELGDVYSTLVRRNFICSPTIVFQTSILKKEGGYDGSLNYEDFDIQIRLARKYPLVFSDHLGILKRKHPKSLSAGQYQRYQSVMLPSTVRVCRKIHEMNTHDIEDQALGVRILHELKHALWSANFEPAKNLIELGDQVGLSGIRYGIYKFWLRKKWDMSWLYLKIKT